MQNGFKVSDLLRECEKNEYPIIVLIKSKPGKIFGGYTER